ncbi:Reverse transcriptase zinc-binding domain - like 8 [Theobroma cacao]|nr:Reverse transcriptase zinc-binding domain - like 8 [Theobroma cacao]
MRSKYCAGQIPRNVQPKLHDSQIWKQMLASCLVTEHYTRWRIGKGELFFWHDCWMGEAPLVSRFPSFASFTTGVHFFYDNGKWDVGKLNDVLLEDVVAEILKILIDPQSDDRAYWVPTSDGQFTTKFAWEIVRQRQSRLLQDWIPVDSRLKTKGFQLTSKCQHCNSEESLLHVMWECPIVTQSAVENTQTHPPIISWEAIPLVAMEGRSTDYSSMGMLREEDFFETIQILEWYLVSDFTHSQRGKPGSRPSRKSRAYATDPASIFTSRRSAQRHS